MKIFFTLSLITNAILGYLILTRKPEKEIVEKVVVKTKYIPQKNEVQEVSRKDSGLSRQKPHQDGASERKIPEYVPFEVDEFNEVANKLEADRMEFLTDKLQMSEEQIKKINKIKEAYYKKMDGFWKEFPHEQSIEDRRRMLDEEESFLNELEAAYGQENWARYQKFRNDYNKRSGQEQFQDSQPFVFMAL